MQAASRRLQLQRRLFLLNGANVQHVRPARWRCAAAVERTHPHAPRKELDWDACRRIVPGLERHLLVDRLPLLLLEGLRSERLRRGEVGSGGCLARLLAHLLRSLREIGHADLDELNLVAVNGAAAPLPRMAPLDDKVRVRAMRGGYVHWLGGRKEAVDEHVDTEGVGVRGGALVHRHLRVQLAERQRVLAVVLEPALSLLLAHVPLLGAVVNEQMHRDATARVVRQVAALVARALSGGATILSLLGLSLIPLLREKQAARTCFSDALLLCLCHVLLRRMALMRQLEQFCFQHLHVLEPPALSHEHLVRPGAPLLLRLLGVLPLHLEPLLLRCRGFERNAAQGKLRHRIGILIDCGRRCLEKVFRVELKGHDLVSAIPREVVPHATALIDVHVDA